MAANKVIRSIEAPGSQVCVDVFRRPNGSFGFELYRRDPEDDGGWYPVGGFAELPFVSESAAVAAACDRVEWFGEAS